MRYVAKKDTPWLKIGISIKLEMQARHGLD